MSTLNASLKLLCALSLTAAPLLCFAHGGLPRVLSINPKATTVQVLDTLGVFELRRASVERPFSASALSWRWLCDDAVDESAGLEVASQLSAELLLAVARSGFYRSDDGGCSFQRVEGPLAQHSVRLLHPHPLNPQEVVAATQTLGVKNDLFKSTDGGRTWRAAGLEVEGSVYALWRDPLNPSQLWVNHAQGLSVSDDGGASFREASLEVITNDTWGLPLSAEEVRGLTSRPAELKLLGGGYGRAGELEGQRLLWMSVNRYPRATLLQKLNDEPWTPIHQVNDSYESLTFTGRALLAATTFEGLFRVDLTASPLSPFSWGRSPELSLGCLTTSAEGDVWGCSRAQPSEWLIASSSDEGLSWSPVWRDYSDAAGADWGCAAEQPSALACSARCLEEGCDPAGLQAPMSAEGGADELGEGRAGGAPQGDFEVSSPSPSTGCAQPRRHHSHPPLTRSHRGLISLGLMGFVLIYLLRRLRLKSLRLKSVRRRGG